MQSYEQFIQTHVGNQLIYLVGTVGIVWDESGQILVRQDPSWGWWALLGGAKNLGEPIAQTLQRTVWQQAGIQISITYLLGVYSHPKYTLTFPDGRHIQPWVVAFVAKKTGGTLRDGIRAMPIDDLRPHPYALYDDLLQAVERGVPTVEAPAQQDDTRPYFPVLRQHIQRQRIILPGSVMAIRDAEGRVLMIRRKDFSTWDLPAGLSDLGENATRTAIRETQEETGLTVQPLRMIGVYSDPAYTHATYPNGDEVETVGLLLEGKIVSGIAKADQTEVDAIAYQDIDAICASGKVRTLTCKHLRDIQNYNQVPFIR